MSIDREDQTSDDAFQRDLERGNKYQDFLTDKLFHYGMHLGNYTSRERQQGGENKFGMEIKFDDRLKETGNIYIEIGHDPQLKYDEFKPSGLFKDDNTWLFLIGDYRECFIFCKKTMITRCRQILAGKVPVPKGVEFKNTSSGSSTGMVVSRKLAIKWCSKHIVF